MGVSAKVGEREAGADEALVSRFADAWQAIPTEAKTEALNGGWYRESRRTARALARRHHVTLATAAGVIAALSPRIPWANNIRWAEAILRDVDAPVGGYPANALKARRIRLGERPLAVLGGEKVRAFYRAIMGDSDSAVIDVWMLRVAGVQPPQREGKGQTVSFDYAALTEALKAAARAVGVPVADFQAIVWTHARGGAS